MVECEDPHMVVVSFKAPKCLIDLLDSIAREKGLPRSELIRQGLVEIIKRNMNRPTPYKVIRLWS